MYTLSSKIKTFSLVLMVLGLLGIGYGFLTAPKTIQDVEAILASVEKTRCVVTCEEHQINGGLGDSVAQVLSRFRPTPIEMVAVNDSFGESGVPTQLLKKYGLGPENIIAAVEKVLKRK